MGFLCAQDIFTIFLVMCMATLGSSGPDSRATFGVMDYGAVGDGKTDDSRAFSKAWTAACQAASTNPTFQVPQGKKFLLYPTTFRGPCRSSNIRIQIDGNLVAPSDPSNWKGKDLRTWLVFSNLNGFVVDGKGQIDGRGSKWWQTCPVVKENCMRPTALAFQSCSNFLVRGLTHINSQRNHISISNCHNGTLSNLHISAPDESPNTDGINIASSKDIQIRDSNIGTGDDCIAVGTESSFINIDGITCGPGHGISVGSLGINGEKAQVEEILVKNCTLKGTQNGLRIKSWQGGSGYARKITFQDIILLEADNPIIIDQYYCPNSKCQNRSGAVQISDVSYIRVHGTSVIENAVQFLCSQSVGCKNIQVNQIDITSTKVKTRSTCTNAAGRVVNANPSLNCLLRH